MDEKRAQLVAVAGGIALIVAYSVAMMASGGDAAWAWLLLLAGIALLIGGSRLLRRGTSG